MPVPPILCYRPSPSQVDDNAVKLTTDIWKNSQLTVAFQEKQLLEKWGIDEMTILEWANRWKREQDSPVPSFIKFVSNGDKSVEKSDIIVELNDSKRNESKIGCSKPEEQPRMWLDLSEGGDYREYAVVHMFGHILGLEHEHQRSDFWEKVGPHLDTEQMKKDIEISGGKYKDYKSKATKQSRNSVYDPDSVMHYWFKKEWLKEKYNSANKIQKERDELAISISEMEALLGIIHRDSSHPLVTTPSEKDLMLLKEVYGGSKQQIPSVVVMAEPADLDLEIFKKDRMDDQKAQEIHTKMVVQYDNLCQRLRKKLVTQEDVLRGLQDTINFSVQGNPQFKKAAGHLTSPTTVEGFFDILPQHTHYLDFNGILDHLIRDHGDHELKEDAKLYRHEFLDLLGRVTVKQAVEGGLFPIIIDDEDKIPKNFSKVEQHILKDSDKDRLIDIIKYRTRFTSRVQLHHLLFCVMGIEKLDYEYNADFKNTVAASPHNSSEVQQELKQSSGAAGDGHASKQSLSTAAAVSVPFAQPAKELKAQAEQAPTSVLKITGHIILTKSELEGLRALMDLYCKEALAKLEKQGGSISRDKVKKLLKEHGLEQFADDFEESVQRGLDYKAYKEALDGAHELTLKYLKFLFIGPPRSGKSTFRRRLIKEIVNLHELGKSANSESTGVSEGNDVTIMKDEVTIKKIVSEHIAIAERTEHGEAAEGSQESHESRWESMKKLEGDGNNAGEQSSHKDMHLLTHLFFKLISINKRTSPDTQAKNEMTMSEQQPEPSVTEPESKEGTMSSVVEQESEATMSSEVKQESVLDRKSPLDKKSKNEAEVTPSMSENKDQDIDKAFNQLDEILQKGSPQELEKLLQGLELIMVNMMDVGGQPALLEMLPPLTIGPALYLLFFRLDQELNKAYDVKFRAKGSKEDSRVSGQYRIKDVLYQSLSSIACFSYDSKEEEDSEEEEDSGEKKKSTSKVLLFGTYLDEARRKKVDIPSMEKELNEFVEKVMKNAEESMKNLVLKAPNRKSFFSVDNMYGEEHDISKVRQDIEMHIENFVPIKVPAVWLMLRVVLLLMNKPIVTLSQCEVIFERLSEQMRRKSSVKKGSVKSALRFFHHNVGNLMYYDKIHSMRDTVICDPQVIMDSVSSLIFDRFNKSRKVDEFEKGLFTFDEIADVTKENRSKYLEVDQLIDLLKDRNILAEFEEISQESEQTVEQGREEAHEIASKQADEQRRKQTDEQGSEEAYEIASKQADEQRRKQTDEQRKKQRCRRNRKFIMPAVLPIASDVEMDWLRNPSQAGEELKKSGREYHKAPIMIHFSCGFVPFGVFSACMAYLIEPKNEKSLQWVLSNDAVYRNMVTFRVNKKKEITKFFVTLISRLHCFEIQVSTFKIFENELNFQCICPSVQQDIVNALKTLMSNWKYIPYGMSEKPRILFHLAFRCSLDLSHSEHLMKFEGVIDGKLTCMCLQGDGAPTLCEEQEVWFDKVNEGTKEEEVDVAPCVDDANLKCPVCLYVKVDPCTLSCGHTFCQLCLACMWKDNNKICPMCKEAWKIFPTVSYDYRSNIESAHGCEVERVREEYSQKDKELIQEYLEAKRIFNSKLEVIAQGPEEKVQLPGPGAQVWKLPGVEECDEMSVVVHSSQGQLIEWNGLKLHIHAGSLPEGLQQCTIFIKASLAGDYEIPENTSLVSGIFWLRCEPQCIFVKPITVEIQHCSTKRDLSKLKIVRALCSQKSLPYKFKPLGGYFNADTSYGAIDMKGFSGVSVTEGNPDSGRMYYSQLFYRSCLSDQQRHEIHITFVWNTELHKNDVSRQYPEDSFLAGCHRVVEIEGKVIEVVLDAVKWTKVMDGQWEIQSPQPMVTKAELDDFKPGRGLPSCVLEARPLCEDFPQLLHQVILNGIKPPQHKVILSYMPSRMNRDYPSGASVQQPQSPPTVQTTTTVPLNVFCSKNPRYKAVQIVCNEAFKKLVERYLESSDKTLAEIKEKYMDQAFKGAKYFHSKVEVDIGSIKELDPIRKCLGDSVTFTNNDNVDSSKTFTQIVEYTTGTELTETVTSGWSITGGLSAEYQGIGASAGVGYSEQQSETIKRIRGTKERKDMTDTFPVKRKSSRRVTVIRTMQRKECQVRNVEISFPRDAKLKCKFHMKADSNNVEKKPRFLIREILDDCIENKGADPLIAKLKGKCVWVETDLKVNVEPDKPLHE